MPGPNDSTDPRIVSLIAKIENDLERLDITVADMQETIASPASPKVLANACSTLLQQFYTGLESTSEKCLKVLDVPPPVGINTHQLLLQATFDNEIFPDTFRSFLIDLQKFRHFMRHGYGVKPTPPLILAKTTTSIEQWPALRTALSDFISKQ